MDRPIRLFAVGDFASALTLFISRWMDNLSMEPALKMFIDLRPTRLKWA